MTGQLDLLGPKPPTLTTKQRWALEQLRDTEGGLSAEELGRRWYDRRGIFPRSDHRDWYFSAGQSVLRSKTLKGLVVRRKATGCFELTREGRALVAGAAPDRTSAPATNADTDPFPAGY